MNLLYGEEEQELRSAVRQVLADRSPWPAVLVRTESDEPYDRSLWRTLAADIGCAGLAVPEKFGGAGASWREAAVVAEELGRAVAPVPYLGFVLATAALLASEDEELLPDLAAGGRTAVLALPLSTPPGAAVWASVHADGASLTGTVTSVADALAADILIVPTPDGLFAVDAADVTRTPIPSLDLTRPLCDLSLHGASGRVLGDGEAAERILEQQRLARLHVGERLRPHGRSPLGRFLGSPPFEHERIALPQWAGCTFQIARRPGERDVAEGVNKEH